MSALKSISLSFLIVFVISHDVSADDVLRHLFNTEVEIALGGSPAAMYIVGTMYEEGIGVEKNDEQAIAWYQKSAAQGNREAAAKLLGANLKKGISPVKIDPANKAAQREQVPVNESEAKLTRERQASEKARQEAALSKAEAARVEALEQQLAHDRVDAEKIREANERSRRINAVLEAPLTREKVDAEKVRAEANKVQLEGESPRLSGERGIPDRVPEPFPLIADEASDAPADATANSTEFKANPCDTPAARFMSTCQ